MKKVVGGQNMSYKSSQRNERKREMGSKRKESKENRFLYHRIPQYKDTAGVIGEKTRWVKDEE